MAEEYINAYEDAYKFVYSHQYKNATSIRSFIEETINSLVDFLQLPEYDSLTDYEKTAIIKRAGFELIGYVTEFVYDEYFEKGFNFHKVENVSYLKTESDLKKLNDIYFPKYQNSDGKTGDTNINSGTSGASPASGEPDGI